MSSRRKDDYSAVFRDILDLPPNPAVQRAVADFEAAAWQAVWSILPEVDVRVVCFTTHRPCFERYKRLDNSEHTQQILEHDL